MLNAGTAKVALSCFVMLVARGNAAVSSSSAPQSKLCRAVQFWVVTCSPLGHISLDVEQAGDGPLVRL